MERADIAMKGSGERTRRMDMECRNGVMEIAMKGSL